MVLISVTIIGDGFGNRAMATQFPPTFCHRLTHRVDFECGVYIII